MPASSKCPAESSVVEVRMELTPVRRFVYAQWLEVNCCVRAAAFTWLEVNCCVRAAAFSDLR